MNAKTKDREHRNLRPLRGLRLAASIVPLVVLSLVAWTSGSPAQAQQGVRLVVNAENPVSVTTATRVARIFLKIQRNWEDGGPIIPVDRSDSLLREAFNRAVMGRSGSTIESHWQRMVFAARQAPPEKFSTDEEVLDFVRANPGAIGYVSLRADLGFGVKVLMLSDVEVTTIDGLGKHGFGEPTGEDPDSRVILVLDVSGSMSGRIQGELKIDMARLVIEELLLRWDPEVHLGLVVYGHRGGCNDVELVFPVASPDSAAISETMWALEPRGMTPLTLAVRQAAETLRYFYEEEKARVVLVSDGKETCGLDPCTIGPQLAAMGVNFTAYVVGFDLPDEAAESQLTCLAQQTGGEFARAWDKPSLFGVLAVAFEHVTDGVLSLVAPEIGQRTRSLMSFIPGGKFEMGSPPDEVGHEPDETLHKVTLTRDFQMRDTEVTQGEWKRVMHGNPSFFNRCGSSCPVERVNWFEALEFTNRRSELDGLEKCYDLIECQGRPGGGCSAGEAGCQGDYVCSSVRFKGLDCGGYRLPTEAEWEYAASAGTSMAFWLGQKLEADDANFTAGAGAKTRGAPVAVRSFSANKFGLYDVHGNVSEWVWDELVPYPPDARWDPVSGWNPESQRGIRGGSWADAAVSCRLSNRDAKDPRSRSSTTGFRLVKTAKGSI